MIFFSCCVNDPCERCDRYSLPPFLKKVLEQFQYVVIISGEVIVETAFGGLGSIQNVVKRGAQIFLWVE